MRGQGETYKPPAPAGIARKVFREICDERDISIDELLGDCRDDHLVRARRAAIMTLCIDRQYSTCSVSRHLRRDASTVRYHVRLLGHRPDFAVAA